MRHEDAHTIAGGRTVSGVLRDGAERHPDRVLLVFEDAEGRTRTFTWSELLGRTLAVAVRLAQAGVGRGDRVHLHLPNRPEFLLAWFAAAELGASIVPTNTLSTAHELEYVLGHAQTGASVTDAAGVAVVGEGRERAGVGGEIVDCDADPLVDLPPVARVDAFDRPDPLDELAVLYTSGTTSQPKGVRISHANYVFAGEVLAAGLRLRPEDRFLTVLPLFHANSQYYATMGTLVSGGTIVLAHGFSASGYMDLAIRHEATVASLFAAPIRMILAKDPQPHWRAHRLRVVAFAQNLTDAELARWDEVVGAPLLQMYGMTETIGPPLMNPLSGRRRHSSIGRPALGYTCRIVREDGAPAAMGEPGELLVGGVPAVSLMAGYLHDPEATAKALEDGWLRTGDVVQLDPDGLISFVDRSKDMIKRAGENVAASEVEAVVMAHPGVRDAAVVGVPDPMRDEQIIAFVVVRDSESLDPQDVIDWCAERLSRFRVPSSVEVVCDLPRTSVGKIQKHRLRESWFAGNGSRDADRKLPAEGGSR